MPAMPTEQRDWYDTPLYYDIIFDDGTKQEADFLEGALVKHGGKGKRLFEPACGRGRMVLDLAGRGSEVRGFDGNSHLICVAKVRTSKRYMTAALLGGGSVGVRRA